MLTMVHICGTSKVLKLKDLPDRYHNLDSQRAVAHAHLMSPLGIEPTIRVMLTALPDWTLGQFNSLLGKMAAIAGTAQGILDEELAVLAETAQMKPVHCHKGEEIDEISIAHITICS